jgi:hypothetical protein
MSKCGGRAIGSSAGFAVGRADGEGMPPMERTEQDTLLSRGLSRLNDPATLLPGSRSTYIGPTGLTVGSSSSSTALFKSLNRNGLGRKV